MKIAIFGAGTNGLLFSKGMSGTGRVINAFLDQSSKLSELNGIPVLRVGDILKEQDEWQIFCAIFPHSLNKPSNNTHVEPEIKLKQLGFVHIYSFYETLQLYPEIIKGYFNKNHLWMRPNLKAMVDHEKIAQVRELLNDETSRQLLNCWILWRETQSMEYYIAPDDACEYFPNDIEGLFPADPLRFVDCGAYTGDTIVDLYGVWKGEIESVVCFEPDLKNLELLNNTLMRIQTKDKVGYTYPTGVGKTCSVVSFSGGQGSSSTMMMGGEGDLVPVVSIDQTVGLSHPNYIKMDIEGAELEALQGAKELIAREAPSLAICLYHKPADLWEIPLYINSIQPSYKMDIRTHDHLGLSTVLYCYKTIT